VFLLIIFTPVFTLILYLAYHFIPALAEYQP
jgi:hypothetical protein